MPDPIPLSARLEALLRQALPGGSAETIAEAAELARRFERAPRAELQAPSIVAPIELRDADPEVLRMDGKRVALLEVSDG